MTCHIPPVFPKTRFCERRFVHTCRKGRAHPARERRAVACGRARRGRLAPAPPSVRRAASRVSWPRLYVPVSIGCLCPLPLAGATDATLTLTSGTRPVTSVFTTTPYFSRRGNRSSRTVARTLFPWMRLAAHVALVFPFGASYLVNSRFISIDPSIDQPRVHRHVVTRSMYDYMV